MTNFTTSVRAFLIAPRRSSRSLIASAIIAVTFFAGVLKLNAQSGVCGPNVPFFSVNLAGNPGGTWVSSPPVSRQGNCCGTQSPDRCIEFQVTLDPSAIAINFQIASGAIPPGALFYQIGCGPQVPVGSPICVNGPGPHTITFCKPGNNLNTYAITSVPGPAVSPADTTGDGCQTTAWVGGLIESSITWTEITSGTGAYLSYLNCTSGCDTVTITPPAVHPPYVDFLVCGTPVSVCYPSATFCDTVRVHFLDPIQNTISPNPPAYCADQNGVMLVGNINGGLPPYTFQWTNALNGSGTVVGTNGSYYATSPGDYSMIVYDKTYPACPAKITNVSVTVHPVPTVNAGQDKIVCATNPAVALTGSVTNSTGGLWTSSGSGYFTPSNTALNAVYNPSPADISAGLVTLTLTTTGMGPCAAVSDQMQIVIDPAINITIPTPVVCYGQSGSITANVSGGTAPYFYSWNTGGTTSTINNIYPGSYTVTVSDGLPTGCVATQVIQVTENPPINITTPFNSTVSCDTMVNITVAASGGTAPLTYLWNTGATTTSINVPTGQYIVTVTDAVGCTKKDTVGINAANSVLTASVNQPANLCYGATTNLSATATGGFGSYTYSWNTGATGNSITVGAGTYCATVTDAQGCINQKCVTITQSSPLSVSISNAATICYGSQATITATASGGAGAYSYSWNTGNAGSSLTAPAGTYTVTVTDGNSPACVATAIRTIVQASPLVVTGSSTIVSCNGGSNGSATATVSGSVAPYSYFWPVNSSTSNTTYGLSAGNYQVNVTDAIGCTQSITVNVSQPPVISAAVTSSSNVSCYGASNGSATVLASGGTPAYSYYWSPAGGSNSMGTGLSAGNYTVTVTDSKGCYTTATAVITQPAQLSGAVTGVTPASCYGGTNGSASVSASGGNGNYTYYWQETGGNSAIENGLGAGTYNVTITDWAGCITTTQAIITAPPPLAVTVQNVSAASCNGAANGSALLSAAGGTPNYTYYWPTTGANGAAISNLSAGVYTYSVTDVNNCSVTNSVTITQPPVLTVTAGSVTNVTCYGMCNGSASFSASGGTPPYSYSWSSGQTTATASSLCAGTYTATATDSKGCVASITVTVTQPPALSLSATTVAANCNHPDGSATVTAGGGTPAYYYSWNTNPVQYSPTASNLVPGNYIITVTDNKNCIATASVTVNNTPGVSITSQSYNNTTCSNSCNGNATIAGTGGTGPYSYFWNTSPAQNTPTASNLCAGNYSVIISDANNCKDTAVFTITAPLPVSLTASASASAICAGDAVTLSANASGGTGSFTYSWNSGAYYGQYYTVSPTANTSYTVTATDANGCVSASQLVTVNVHPVPAANAGTDKTVCSTAPVVQLNGTVTNATGGTWSGGAGSFMPSATSLNATYTPTSAEISAGQITLALTTTGSGACAAVTDYITITIAQQFSVTINNGIVCYGQTGSLNASVSGGIPPYSFTWNTGATTPTISNVPPGNYFVTVTDAIANGCSSSQSGTISQNPQMFVNLPPYTTSCNTTATVTATGTGGNGALSYLWSTGSSSQTISVPSGSYTVTVYDAGGCSVKDTVVVNAVVAPISAFITQPNNLCYGSSTNVTASASGGYGSFSYIWSNGSGNATITVPAGSYFVTATDSAGCSDTANVTVTQSAPLSVSIANPPAVCNGANATVSANVSGGKAPYAYLWSNGQTTSSITMPAGTYSVTVTDANSPSCSASATVTINQATPLAVTATTTPVSCFSGNNGSATVNASGSVGPYTYAWASYTNTSSTMTGLVAGNYQATVTDAIGCAATVTVTITQPSQLNLSGTSVAAHCFHPDGNATINVSGGTPSYSYAWNTSPVQNSSTATNLAPGNYVVTVTDFNNCVQTATVTVGNLAGVAITSTSSTNTQCSYTCDGNADVTVGGGTSPYSYFWNTSPVQTTPAATALCAGTYSVIVYDFYNCTDTAYFTIGTPPAVNVTPVASTGTVCAGNATMLSASASGGTGTYTYSWNNGAYSGQNYLVSPAVNTTYTVVASDANGCQSAAQTVSVTVNQVPVVNAGADATVCSSSPIIQLNGSVSNAGGGIWSGGSGMFMPSATALNATYSPTAAEIASGQITLVLTSTGNGACQAVNDSKTVTIAQQFSVTVANSLVCFGQNGSLNANVSGGIPPYNFTWSTGANTQGIVNAAPGSYNVSVSDAVSGGCTAVQSGSIIENPQININLPGYTTSCVNSATVTATASGGSGSLTYLWNTGASTSSVIVPAGSYSVTVYDANGCSLQDNVVVNAVVNPIAASVSQPANLCNGATTTISASVSGGYGSYTYLWNTGAQTSSITGGAASYNVIVSDSAGCSDTAFVAVTESAPLQVTIPAAATICNGATQTLTTVVSGGSGPYFYSWSNGQSTSSITAAAGSYSVTITDSNTPACTATASGLINQATPLVVNGNAVNVSCFGGSNGSASVQVSGGIAPYVYSWSSGATSNDTISGLVAGSYSVAVTDSIGCVQTTTITVTEPTAIASVITSTSNVTCFGGNNGSASVGANGGAGSYSYAWMPAGGSGNTATGLSANNYTVTVTDQNGCSVQSAVAITQPSQLVISSANVTHVSCYGGSNGNAAITPAGGTGSYTFLWSDGSVNSSAGGLNAGNYSVTVTDASGCIADTTVTITQPAPLADTIASASDVTCYGAANGSATIAALGGTPGYNYTWPSLNLNSATASGLAAGTYNYAITDSNGCTITSSVSIAQPAAVTLNVAMGFNTSCSGTCDGMAVVVASGGQIPFTYQWSSGQTAPNINNLCAGNYSVTVTDANGCYNDTVITIGQPAPVSVSSTSVPSNCFHADGSATASASGGNGGYSYSWNTTPPQSGANATALVPASYIVTVTDNKGCQGADTVTVANLPGVIALVSNFSNTTCSNVCNGTATAAGNGGAGPYSYSWSTTPVQTSATANTLCPGMYTVTITDANNCTSNANVTISAPPALSLTPLPSSTVICNGESAVLTASASGGTGNIIYSWNNGSHFGSTYTVSPAVTTTYTVVAIDSNFCTSSPQAISVTINPALTAIVAPGFSICQGASVNLSANASGGNGNYMYLWGPDSMTGQEITVIPPSSMTYSVLISDGCSSDTAFIPITVYPLPAVNFSTDLTTGCAPLCVEFVNNSTSSSGSNIVQWEWQFGDNDSSFQANPTHCFTQSGAFDVTLTAVTNQGCSKTFTYNNFIQVQPSPIAEFTFNPEFATATNPVVTFTEQASGENWWLWDFGDDSDTSMQKNPEHTYNVEGEYCVMLTVRNSYNCYDTAVHCLKVQPQFTFYIPNAFTPNGNTRNETFTGKGENIVDYTMWIYDRWGNMIFETHDLNVPWDGRANGGKEIAQEDVYVYLVKLTDIYGEKHEYVGHVTLVK